MNDLDLDAIEAQALTDLREHEWVHPEGYAQHCQVCLLRHGAWAGEGCPGTSEPEPPYYVGPATWLALVAEVRRLRALALAVIQADDDSVSYEPCGECLKSGVALLEGASYDRLDTAVEALRAALPVTSS